MKNILKKKIINKERLYGTHVNLADPCICDIVGRLGYDFIWVDMEHSYLSYKDLLSHIIAAKGVGTPVIVRIPQDDLTATKKILEMGPDGVIFPMVRSKEEIDKLMGYTLYPPYGNRGFGPMGAIHYGIEDVNEYVEENTKELCRFIQIEHKDLVDNIEEIANNEYIDGYIFGPNDLSGSVGELLHVFDESTDTLIRKAIKVLKEKGKCIGVSTYATDEETLRHWHNMGIDMISAGADYPHILNGAKDALETLKKIHPKQNA